MQGTYNKWGAIMPPIFLTMKSFHWILSLAVFAACFAATPPAQRTTKKAVPTAGKTPVRKSIGKTATTRRTKGSARPYVAGGPPRQQNPAPERYKEIQQALTEKGYLKTEPTGVWDTESSEALKQFQQDHQLSPTGKLSAASLIGLGLGPKNSTEPVTPPAVTRSEAPPR